MNIQNAVIMYCVLQPEGVPQQYSTSVFITLSPGQQYSNVLTVTLPAVGLVPDSQYIEVTAIGWYFPVQNYIVPKLNRL